MMMTFENFKKKLVSEVQEALGDERKVCVTVICKNNQTEKEVLIFEGNPSECTPAIHLSDLYKQLQAGITVEMCRDEVLAIVNRSPIVNVSKITDNWDEIKERIFPVLVNKQWNEQRLENLVHMDFLNFAVMLKYYVDDIPAGKGSINVSHELMEAWGIDEHVLWKTAAEKLENEEFTIMDLEDIVMREFGTEFQSDRSGALYILTNQGALNGAAAMLRTDILTSFAESIGRNFYILPSSIHELILLPDRGNYQVEELQEMVRTVNLTTVAEEERLSDDIYYFNRKYGRVELIS